MKKTGREWQHQHPHHHHPPMPAAHRTDHRKPVMKKLLLPALLAFAACVPAQAHHIWIEQAGKTATLQFGEFGDNLRETSPGLLDKFVTPTATLVGPRGEQPVKLEKTPKGFVLSRTAAPGESIVIEEATYPYFENKKDGQTTRHAWTPAARYVTTFAAQEPKLTFDIVPTGQQGQFRVVYKGKPAPKVKVNAVIPNGWSKEATSNDEGLVHFDLPWRGSYVIEAHHQDSAAGERDGKPYDNASYVTALSFKHVAGAPALPAGPAAAPGK